MNQGICNISFFPWPYFPLFLLIFHMHSHSWLRGIMLAVYSLLSSLWTYFLLYSLLECNFPLPLVKLFKSLLKNQFKYHWKSPYPNVFLQHTEPNLYSSWDHSNFCISTVCCLCGILWVPHNFYLNYVLYTGLKSLVWTIVKTKKTWDSVHLPCLWSRLENKIWAWRSYHIWSLTYSIVNVVSSEPHKSLCQTIVSFWVLLEISGSWEYKLSHV